MQFATTRPNETLEQLATRVYDLGDRPSEAARRAAAKALAEANPLLRHDDDVPPGTVVDVPPVPEAAYRPGATETEDAVLTGLLLDHVRAAAALFARQLSADLETETATTDTNLQLARSRDLKRLKDPVITETLRETVAAVEARVANVNELRARQDMVLRQLAEDIEALERAFSSGGPRAD